MSLLKFQLDNACPIIYSGKTIDDRWHTFVCDGYGYDPLDTFFVYCNFGVGNYDGFFKLDEIHVQNDTFIYNQKAIINIYPNDRVMLCSRDVLLDEYYLPYQDEIASGTLFPWGMLPVTVTNLTSASSGSPGSWRTIPTGEESVYRAQESIVLKDGFVVERGADFAAIISPCDNCGHSVLTESRNAPVSSSTSENTEEMRDPFPRQEEPAAFLGNGLVGGVEAKEAFTIMPNPASSYVTVQIHLTEEDAHGNILTLLDDMGNEHLRRIINKGETRLTLPLEGIPSGLYFVTLATAEGTSTQKLVIN